MNSMMKKNKYVSKSFWKDQSTAMSRINEYYGVYDDMINLSLGDPDIITPKPIIDAAFQDAYAGHTKYTEFRGDPELIAEIIRFYNKEYNISISNEEMLITSSATTGMYLTLRAILDPGDEVIMQAPFFTPYPNQVRLAGGIPVEMATYEEEDFQINVERLRTLINERTKALIICSPSNPTGNCLEEKTMLEIAKIAEENDLIVISDEIYTSFVFQGKFRPFCSIGKMKERTVAINTFSKNFMMTGWRIGNIIGPREIIAAAGQINDSIVFTSPSISQRAALHALKMRKDIQPSLVAEYKKRMEYAAKRINRIPQMHVIYPPKGSFYLFINIRKMNMTSEEAVDFLFHHAHVLTLPGNAFGKCGEGYIRIACTVGVEKLKEAFNRIENVMR